MSDNYSFIQSFFQELFAHLGSHFDEVRIDSDDQHLNVTILLSEEESGLFIGHHGENLSNLQRLVNIVFQDELENKKVLLNINDYRERRADVVNQIVQKTIVHVLETGRPMALPVLPANERLLAHMQVKAHPELQSNSEGMGNQRRVIISFADQPQGN